MTNRKIALGETPVLGRKAEQVEAVGPKLENGAIIKQRNGEFAARASFDGVDLGIKPVGHEIGVRYFSLPDGKEKERLLATTLNSSYAHEIGRLSHQRERTLSVG